ncbi:MAG: SUMF1/EgtB/PvdO family nonheme iron enzyme, partial [Hyphomicrobiaceae bacterium]
MTEIFVSYRRDDSQWSAGRLNDRIEAALGADRVFFDTVTIKPGEDFHDVLGAKVGGCRVLVAVIGPRWLDILEARTREGSDFVRIELAEGLARGVRVVPVLIDGARMPSEDVLPDDLKPLARRNAVLVRAETFRADADQLIAFLRQFLGDGEAPGAPAASIAPVPRSAPTPVSASAALPMRRFDMRVGPLGKERLVPLAAGESVSDIPFGPEMVLVPPGHFWMGSPEGEGDANERPRHEVTIGYPLLVGKYPVTFEEWDFYVEQATREGTGGSRQPHRPKDHGWGRGRQPVVDVSWQDAVLACEWLSRFTGKAYRLLSEAVWEYCCRAGSDGRFCFGHDPQVAARHAWHRGNSGQQPHPVGQLAPNAFGLFDMHGNVLE